jgi:hypothetical protein
MPLLPPVMTAVRPDNPSSIATTSSSLERPHMLLRLPSQPILSVARAKMEDQRRESLLQPLRQRIRDVRQGPDGLLYLLTDEDAGAVVRIEPAS